MHKLDLWFSRRTPPLLCAAGVLIVLAAVLSRLTDLTAAASIIYLAAFLLSGTPIVLHAVRALRYKTVSIELLVSVAAIGACVIAEFSEAAVVTFLFRLGSFLEQKTMKKTRSAIRSLTELVPTTACRIVGSGEGEPFSTEEIDADEVQPGDLLLVKTGSRIAADGVVAEGEGFAAEAGITGEPLPKHKAVGDPVYAGTVLEGGVVHMRAAKVGEDTTFSRIVALVEEAQDAKSPAERFIDRFARYYTPAVIAAAALVLLFTRSADTAITVLVLACPGALVIGAPIANVAGIGRGAQEGILLKGGDSIRTFAKTDTLVFDKTGTLTAGAPSVCAQYAYTDDPQRALCLGAAAERASDHPLAQAVLRHAADLPALPAQQIQTVPGGGMRAAVDGHRVLVGGQKLLRESGVPLPPQAENDLAELQRRGASVVLIAVDGAVALLLGIADAPKPDAADSLHRLKAMGIRDLIMLTGDNTGTAAAVAAQLGLTQYRAELLPADKSAEIRHLQAEGRKVTFVGDGINDAPALATADTGIAMGSGTDVAIDGSDVVLIRSDLQSLVRALHLSRRIVAVMGQNIAIAVGTVALLLVGLFLGYIHMSLGMLIHEASILAVIFNAMRLLIRCRKKENET